MTTTPWMTAVLAVALPALLPAQTYRTMVETRRVADRPLRVDLALGVGDLRLHPAEGSRTYRIGLTYAEDVFTPEVRYEPSSSTLTVKVAGNDGKVTRHNSDGLDQEFDVALPRDVPLDLTLAFGAIEADMELGGLALRTAEIKTGASDAVVAFSEPARGSCDRLTFNVGAAQFEARGLGNSGCRTITLTGAVGEMELDFSGEQAVAETRLVVKVGLGEVRLRIPEAVGIRLDSDRFLASVDRAGLVKRGSVYESPGYARAERKLVIDVAAALGSVEIERIP